MGNKPNPQHMTPKEAAAAASVSVATMYNAIRDKKIKTVKKRFKTGSNMRLFISQEALADYLLSKLNGGSSDAPNT